MATPKIALVKIDEKDYIKIDCGDHYYLGLIDSGLFPQDITNNLPLVEKALKGYKNGNETVYGSFEKKGEDHVYEINYSINCELFSKKFTVDIILEFHQKEQMDYINERFTELDTQIVYLKEENEKLRNEIINITTSNIKTTIYNVQNNNLNGVLNKDAAFFPNLPKNENNNENNLIKTKGRAFYRALTKY